MLSAKITCTSTNAGFGGTMNPGVCAAGSKYPLKSAPEREKFSNIALKIKRVNVHYRGNRKLV